MSKVLTEPRHSTWLLAWMRNPLRVGAVAPSSRHLAERMAAQVGDPRGQVVVELGGGTGAITRALLAHGIEPGNLVVVERDPLMYQALSRAFPDLPVVRGDAAHLVALLTRRGIGQVGAVVSGLPLLGMPVEVRRAIVKAAFEALRPGGRFVQFTYGPTVPVPPAVLAELGLQARSAGLVLRNVPPARIWVFERMADRPA